jgi:hypothetical protein
MHGAIPPLSQYVFMAWCLVKHRDDFTFTLQHGDNYHRICIGKLRKTMNNIRSSDLQAEIQTRYVQKARQEC